MGAIETPDPAPESNVPPWPVFVQHVLVVLSRVPELPRRQLREEALDISGISADARAELLPSGGTRAANRVNWAITHLSKAGFIHPVRRGVHAITEAGREWLGSHPQGLQNYAEANELFKPFWASTTATPTKGLAVETGLTSEVGITPTEQVIAGVEELNSEVADDLLGRLQEAPPEFFEHSVVRSICVKTWSLSSTMIGK